jgi:hypothetical protein
LLPAPPGEIILGLLSSSTALTRYFVEGNTENNLKEIVFSGLTKHAISPIDDDTAEKTLGWTSFKEPFSADFEGYSFIYGNYFAFSIRIDKKSIPANLVKKYIALESDKRLKASGREFLSRNEKKMIKEHVLNFLYLRIPATPHIYNILWNYERSVLFFFTNIKAPNQTLETLFYSSFNLRLIRIFPYTLADLAGGLSAQERDTLEKLSFTPWSE